MRADPSGKRGSIAALLAIVALLAGATGCLLPVRRAPGAGGRVMDAETGRPVADAIVVVRFDAWYDDVLPDRELIAHRETRSDAAGRFAVDSVVRPGLTVWPLLRTEARIVGVMAEGYRCPTPQTLRARTTVRLTPARDAAERRDSCRPLAARHHEARAYMEAWRDLFPPHASRESREQQQELERLLSARSAFGFGQNCFGPVSDLAMDPSGRRVALAVAGPDGSEIHAVELGAGQHSRSEVVSRKEPGRHDRLAWTSDRELVLWEPATQARRLMSGSSFASERFEVVWTAPADERASAAPDIDLYGPSRVLDPTDLNDEGDARWLGRSFRVERQVEPVSGLPQDRLRVTRPDGSAYVLELPGEACGPRGRFGRPHYRIAADGRSGVDLRFVDGGCHALRIDLERGTWVKLDSGTAEARCRQVRSVPAQHMHTALRGYMRDVSEALEAGRADPGMAFALHIGDRGETVAVTRDLKGAKHTVPVPAFPLKTPLTRIEVTVAGGRAATPQALAPPIEPTPL
jgi:hypothetical protein